MNEHRPTLADVLRLLDHIEDQVEEVRGLVVRARELVAAGAIPTQEAGEDA